MFYKFALLSFIFLVVACGSDQPEAETNEPVATADQQTQNTPETIHADFGDATAGYIRKDGFFDIFLDEESGRVYGSLPKPDANGVSLRFIYATGLTAGLGSNPIGLDRGAFDSGVIVSFRRIGSKIIAEQENWTYRASADRDVEKKAVRESFAPSFLWATEILETADTGHLLIDLSGFLTRDHFGVAGTLKNHPQGGTYTLAADRSLPDVSRAFAFPNNVELDAFMTFTSSAPGAEARATAADGRAVTLVQHHSFVRLPEPGFKSRRFDPRTGGIAVSHYDFSAPLDGQIVQQYARRFRLERKNPDGNSGPVKKPIVFYVDPGAPAQIRDALIDGALWWADAFEAAGFEDAYRVELLPEGAHPFDIRYNMIQWTHRQTRGWSYGGGVSDPRTGEMLKANVILGSQRVRQDRMIFEGLAGADKSGTGAADDPVEIALARIRQLSAHEVGHTLGFAHNFAASANDRASVMDYPAPYIKPTNNGGLDFSKAYGVGVGAWDIFSTKWLYSEFQPGADEAAELEKIVTEGYASGLRFVGDREARSVGTGHPHGAVWDNGADATDTLLETMQVRQIALQNFGTRSLRDGQPIADLNNVITPIYLYHRYQVAAAAKIIGGLEFGYGVKGDNSAAAKPVPASEQRHALKALLTTLAPSALELPDTIINQLTPPLGGFGIFSNANERLDSDTAPVFDVLAAVDTAADLTIGALLHPARAARLNAFDRRDPSSLGFTEMLDAIEAQAFQPPDRARLQPIAQIVQTRFVSSLMELSLNPSASPLVRADADAALSSIRARLRPNLSVSDASRTAHHKWLLARINAHLNRAAPETQPEVVPSDTPPGSPIGDPGIYETCWHCEAISPQN